MTILDLGITLFGFSTMVWTGELSSYLAKRFPSIVMVGLFLVLVPMVATVEYILVRLAGLLPAGIPTFVFSVDNSVGVTFLASISLMGSLYLLFPFLKVAHAALPRHIAQEVSITKPPPSKGSGAAYIYISFVVVGLTSVALYKFLQLPLFGQCTEPIDVLCVRISTFVVRAANYLNMNLSINPIIAQFLAVVGAIASILGVIKTGLEIRKLVKSSHETETSERAAKNKSKNKKEQVSTYPSTSEETNKAE